MVSYKYSTFHRLAAVLSAVAVLFACAVPSAFGKPPGPSIHTVFVILLENHNWADIKGNPSAPFINKTLLRRGAHAERYFNPPGLHPSLPNYLWLEAGSNLGIHKDAPPIAVHFASTHHLVSLLTAAHVSWRTYAEGISGHFCPLLDVLMYAPRHNPMVYFDDVTSRNNPRSAYCIAHERPYSQLASDLRNSTVARYNFIVPNLCHDMHNSCPPTGDTVRQGDTWLAHAVPRVLASPAFRQGGAVFITWDEGEHGDGPIGMIVLSPSARRGYAGYVHYTHSATLRTMEEIFGVRPLLGGASRSPDLRDLFTRFP